MGQSVLVLGDDHRNGMKAFFDGRKPDFRTRKTT